ncbi:hypothetical protein [Burkholderia cenocepacia]|uniref:hypothetical protein n=1 Tax=Burkholderia cenocepacia TaxID=95486 RepID=UPI002B251B57|nr:hypothetical protein [Burkholderia cenocepacia]MEB2554098.1 hypothetical protein [Burkholderia cenocepacia]
MKVIEIKNCPFCGANMIENSNKKDLYVARYGTHYTHPEGDCVLWDFEVTPGNVKLWNRRAPASEGEQK